VNPDTHDLPLAVDLDGTLIRGDVFTMQLTRFLVRAPWRVPQLLLWFANGRAYVKGRLASFAPNPATLPYDARVVAWLRAERARGRTIVLASASDRSVVEAVAAHLELFDRVFASDGRTNLKSRRKAKALAAAFPQGFVYAGNEGADLHVWEAAAGAVLVNCDPGFARRCVARFPVERSFDRA
jgi:phosphoserine phosphatase